MGFRPAYLYCFATDFQTNDGDLIVRKFAVLVFLLLPVLPAFAQGTNTYVLNKAHSKIAFSIGHFYVDKTVGQFNSFDGKLTLSPGQGAVTIHIAPASIQTDSAARDEHLRTSDFFDVAKFPAASFDSSSSVITTGGMSGKLTGSFTLHGVTRPITLDVTLMSPDLNAAALNFSASGTLKRSDFGMTSYSGIIGDVVTLTIAAEFDRN
jgi:polyisoprenoid-binding protein YceI